MENKIIPMRKKGLKQVVESKSDVRKLLQVKEDMKKPQHIVGEKQV